VDVIQIQVNDAAQLTFSKGLRSMLRHDPDIMMVGEVRDFETAEISIRVALTGHLILSTLHTNDAASGATRLIDIGIEPYLVASGVEAFVAQRLVRVICSGCKTEVTNVDPEIKRNISSATGTEVKDVKVYTGSGCEDCSSTGFYGRTAIYEILSVDSDIKRMIAEKASSADIKRKAVEKGMKTLLQDGWRKVLEGITTPEEVLNVCQDIEMISFDSGKEDETDSEQVLSEEEESAAVAEENRRVYMRVPIQVPLQYRLLEKGEGDIVKIDLSGQETQVISAEDFAQGAKKGDLKRFADYIFTQDVSDQSLSDEPFKDNFASSANISAGGILFESQYMLPVGSILEVRINIPNHDHPIKCLAKVMRREKNLPRSFNLAACYLDMSGMERKIINEFVKKENGKDNNNTI